MACCEKLEELSVADAMGMCMKEMAVRGRRVRSIMHSPLSYACTNGTCIMPEQLTTCMLRSRTQLSLGEVVKAGRNDGQTKASGYRRGGCDENLTTFW